MSFSAVASALGGLGLGQLGNFINSAMQFHQQQALMQQQFEYNKWFVQHVHQNEVADLRKAGLNPVLSANGGQTASVGLGSSALANDQSMANTLSDAYNTAVQNANSSKALDNAKPVQDAQASLFSQQAQTEFNKRENLDADTNLTKLNSAGKQIENSYLPEKLKSEITLNLNSAKAVSANALANGVLAKAGMINATSGNPTKVISDFVNNPSKYYNDIKKGFSSLGRSFSSDINKHPIVFGAKVLPRLFYTVNKNSINSAKKLKK